MYPNISYLCHDLFGTPLDNGLAIFKTYGLFLLLGIIIGASLIHLELKRKKKEGLFVPVQKKVHTSQVAFIGEVLILGIIVFLLGFKGMLIINNVMAAKADIVNTLASLEGNWLGGVLGVAISITLIYWRNSTPKEEKSELDIIQVWPHERILEMTLLVFFGGLIGSKVFALLENPESFLKDPIHAFFIDSGMAFYGGLIGGAVTGLIYLRWNRIPILPVLDATAPSLMIGYGIGRLGCHFSGDGDWGIANTNPLPTWWWLPEWLWAFDYPRNISNQGIPIPGCKGEYCYHLPVSVFPTSVYECVAALIIGMILWNVRRKFSLPGTIFFVYLILNGIERFVIEEIRVNEHYHIFGIDLTQAQIVAILLIVFGIIGLGIILAKFILSPKRLIFGRQTAVK